MKKIQIRPGVFETNSSSTHSLVICTKEQYEKWKNGDLLWNGWDDKFITKEEVEEKELEDDIYDFVTLEASVNARKATGGTAREAVERELARLKKS